MKRAFVHIGHPKTATTYLQHMMHLNDELLLQAGIVVPHDFRPLGSYDFRQLSQDARTHSGNADPIFRHLEGTPSAELGHFEPWLTTAGQDLLLSSELYFYHPFVLGRLADFLVELGFEVHAIAYIGSYVDMAVKAYVQNVRNARFTGTLADYLRSPAPRTFLRFGEIRERLLRMSAISSLTLRPFSPAHLSGGDIAQDFFGLIAPGLDAAALRRPLAEVNVTLPLHTLEVIRELNATGSDEALELERNSSSEKGAEGRRRIIEFYYTPEAKRIMDETLAEDRAGFVAAMPAEWRAFWLEDPEPSPAERHAPGRDRAMAY